MGRKPLSDSRKYKLLKIRLTDKEQAAIDKKADAAGRPTSTWARELLLAAPAPKAKRRRVTVRTDPAH